MEPILVTGATGKTGNAVASELLRRGIPVRALVRSLDARSERLYEAGAEVVTVDLFDSERLLGAMKGTSRAYYCPPWHPYMVQSAVAFAVAAREARLQAIVGLTQWLASPAHPSLLTRQSWLVDQLFSMVPGAAHVIINRGISRTIISISRFSGLSLTWASFRVRRARVGTPRPQTKTSRALQSRRCSIPLGMLVARTARRGRHCYPLATWPTSCNACSDGGCGTSICRCGCS